MYKEFEAAQIRFCVAYVDNSTIMDSFLALVLGNRISTR